VNPGGGEFVSREHGHPAVSGFRGIVTMPAGRTTRDWTLIATQHLEQADAVWHQPGCREPAVLALTHAAERLLNGALVGQSRPPRESAELPVLYARAAEQTYDVAFFAAAARELAELYPAARYDFLADDVTWERLGALREEVRRLRDALFPRPAAAVSHRGVLVCISGPSGVGKSTICQRLVQRLDAFLSVSATTRPRRENEVDGKHYYFISKEEFERRLEHGGFLEYARVYGGQYYGTPAEPVIEELRAGRTVILEIEIEGTIQVVRRFPEAVTIYVLAPSANDQEQRLMGRREDSEEAIQERLAKADGEIRYAKDCGVYKYFVVNAALDDTVDRVESIIRAQQQKAKETIGV
jgi:guanylate kinase